MYKQQHAVLSYCLMANHWHMVIWPRKDGELTDFLRWLTHAHVMRWHAHYGTSGTGHLYQGRLKSFPMESTTTGAAIHSNDDTTSQDSAVISKTTPGDPP